MRTIPPPLGYAGLLKLSSLPECRTERIEGILFLLLLLPEIAEYRFLDFRAAMMGVDTRFVPWVQEAIFRNLRQEQEIAEYRFLDFRAAMMGVDTRFVPWVQVQQYEFCRVRITNERLGKRVHLDCMFLRCVSVMALDKLFIRRKDITRMRSEE